MSPSDKRMDADRLLVRYLLGSLPAEDAERLDELSIADEEFATRLSQAEYDLVDAYVKGELTGEDVNRFESSYLSSAKRRQRVEFAEALFRFKRKLDTEPAIVLLSPKSREGFSKSFSPWRIFAIPRSGLQWGLAGTAMAVLAVAGYLFMENLRLRRQIGESQGERAVLVQREQQLQKQLSQEQTASAEELKDREHVSKSPTSLDQIQTVSLLLLPPTRGAARVPTIYVRPGTDLVVLLLALESDDFPAYRVTLKDPAAGEVLWRSPRLEPTSGGDRKAVSISFRAGLLKQQNYIAELTGIPASGAPELLGEYPFRSVLK
jgi:hypothetical protein